MSNFFRLLACCSLLLLATSAAANPGIDLGISGCAGDEGATVTGTVDCASGQSVAIDLTWSPGEDLSDLSNLDGFIDTMISGSFPADGFWNFDGGSGCNRNSLSATQNFPGPECGIPIVYLNTWNDVGAGSAIAAAQTGPQSCRYAYTCYRPDPLQVHANEHLFGIQIIISTTNSTEAGGSCSGCSDQVCIIASSAQPGTFDISESPTPLTGPTNSVAGFGNRVALNGGASLCAITPVRRATWGELQSIYR